MRVDYLNFEIANSKYKIPTASRAKGLHLTKSQCLANVNIIQKALKEPSNLSKYQTKRLNHQIVAYRRMMNNKNNFKKSKEQAIVKAESSYLSYLNPLNYF